MKFDDLSKSGIRAIKEQFNAGATTANPVPIGKLVRAGWSGGTVTVTIDTETDTCMLQQGTDKVELDGAQYAELLSLLKKVKFNK